MNRIIRLSKLLVLDVLYLFYYFLKKQKKTYSRKINIVYNKKLPTFVCDNILNNKIQLLGIKYLDFSTPTPLWNTCPITGYKWSNNWHRFVNKERPTITDIKIPWEFSRLQHLTLLKIYENNFRNDIFIKNTIKDFHKKNIIGFGVNWACSMDVSIRAINLVTIALLSTDSQLTKTINSKIIHYYHFISRHDEWNNGNRNNHYLTNLMAKCILAQYLYLITNQNKFKVKSIDLLVKFENEVNYQFTEDGINFEGSINYHRLSTEIVFLTYIFSIEFGFSSCLSNKFKSKLKKMCQYFLCFYNDNGHTQIGDTDSGYILNLSPVYKKLNNEIIQDFSKINNFLYSIDIENINGLSDLIKIAKNKYSNSFTADKPIVCKKINFKSSWVVPTIDNKFNITINDKDNGILKLNFSDGYLLIKSQSIFNTGHSHLDYLKIEAYIDDIYYSMFKGTDSYSKKLESREYDRIGFYRHPSYELAQNFSPLPFSYITSNEWLISENRIRIAVGKKYIEIINKNNRILLTSNTNPFLYPDIYYPSYNSPKVIEYV